MTAIAQQLRSLSMLPALSAGARRLQASRQAYTEANRGLWIVGFGLIALMGLMPFFAPSSHILKGQQALYFGLLALSLNLLVNMIGLISFGHAMFFGFGGYLVAVGFAKEAWGPFGDPLLMFAFTPLIGAVSAFVIGFVVLRGRELYFGLLTLGMGQLIWAAAHGWQSLTGGTNGTTGVFAADWLSPFEHANNLYWFVFLCVLVCTALIWVIMRSPFGDACRAIRENRRRAEFAGIWVKRYEMTAFVIAGTFGAVAGGLAVISETQIASGQIDWQRSAFALIMCLIGGYRYFLGPFAGAIFFIWVRDWLTKETTLWDTVFGIIVLCVALFFVAGLSGTIHWALAWLVTGIKRLRGIRLVDEAPELSAAEHEAVHLPSLASEAAEPRELRTGGEPVLVARNLTKSFGGLVAVNGASIEVRQGTMHAIIGPNGAGKTTFFNLLTGLYKPDSGTIHLEGADVTGVAPWRLVKRGLGRSFQQTNLFWSLTALDNVLISEAAVDDQTLRIVGKHRPGLRERSHQLLDRVGLGSFAGFSASELSHGDQRSLEIASAIAVNSRILLLDEPTAGISPSETRTAVELIRRIARERDLTVVFVEHDMEVVFGIADRITVLARGSVLAEGTPAEIRANPEVQKAYLGETTDEEAGA
ncbi:MAG: branched-chain amino acid ABC transporter ATP-binding protein/permease [Thermoleophilia bacterium]